MRTGLRRLILEACFPTLGDVEDPRVTGHRAGDCHRSSVVNSPRQLHSAHSRQVQIQREDQGRGLPHELRRLFGADRRLHCVSGSREDRR